MAKVLIQFSGILILFGIIYCLQIIPERSNVTFVNPKYIVYAISYIKRYGRKSGYYLNIAGRSKHTWNNNVTLHCIFDEYLHNEYRRSFIEMHYKFCDLVNKEPYIGGMLVKNGIKCPQPAREFQLFNMTIPTDDFPNVFPFEKGRMNLELTLTETGESMARGYINAAFKNKKRKL